MFFVPNKAPRSKNKLAGSQVPLRKLQVVQLKKQINVDDLSLQKTIQMRTQKILRTGQTQNTVSPMKKISTHPFRSADRIVFSCKWCRETFSTKDCRDQHERIVHSAERREARDAEQRSYPNSAAAPRSRSKNSLVPNGESFGAFSTVSQGLDYVTLVERLKSLPKPYKCPLCEKICDARLQFTEHYLAHTGEKPFVCDICGRGFIRASKMQQHHDVCRERKESIDEGKIQPLSDQNDVNMSVDLEDDDDGDDGSYEESNYHAMVRFIA